MAQSSRGFIQPVQFSAAFAAVGEPRLIGEWIVGAPVDGEWGEPEYAKELVFTPTEPALAQWFQDFLRSKGSPTDACRFIGRNGTFRGSDWVSVKNILSSALPKDVKKEVKAMRLPKESKVYVLREEQLWQEIQLLKHLALIPGAVSSRRYTKLKTLVEEANKTLNRIRTTPNVPFPVVRLRPSLENFAAVDDEDKGEVLDHKPKPVVERPKRLPWQEDKQRANQIMNAAFQQALGRLGVRVLANAERGTKLNIYISSVLQLLHVCLLASSGKEWRKCKRPDCSNIFAVGYRKEKVYCDWYCAHLENLRSKRRAEKRKRTKGKKVRR